MLHTLFHYGKSQPKFVTCVRYLSSAEVSTALRPFYFNVHPDLFGQYPVQRAINEHSLKQLSSIIETLQSNRWIKPMSLQFYLRDKKCTEGDFRLIKISIDKPDIREAILSILKSCDLPTEYVNKIAKTKEHHYNNHNRNYASKKVHRDTGFDPFTMGETMAKPKEEFRLKSWLSKHHLDALEKSRLSKPLREEVDRLHKQISIQWQLQELRWDCGWNVTHFRGCLQSFISLAEQHPEVMHKLRGRTLVFGSFTGISLDGHIMLNSGEVRHNWLDLIKNIQKYEASLVRIPSFERSVSQVLRGIKVERRKFMPKIQAEEYERNLQKITTSLSDHLGKRGFPKQWPESLSEYEIVVETEAGPLMVSPTGQFIVPSGLPGFLLVNFISQNLDEASEKINMYKNNKYVERELQQQCIEEFQLPIFRKSDDVTPDLMIQSCGRLLENKNYLKPYLKEMHLNIATYYSVLSDGVVCIPWNWKL